MVPIVVGQLALIRAELAIQDAKDRIEQCQHIREEAARLLRRTPPVLRHASDKDRADRLRRNNVHSLAPIVREDSCP
jgi:hypothetical protein